MDAISFSLSSCLSPAVLNSGSNGIGFFSLILYFLFVGCFIYFVYIATKYFAKISMNMNYGSKEAKVIKNIPIGYERRVTIVKIHGTFYYIHSDKQGSILIDKRDFIPEEAEDQVGISHNVLENGSFKQILSKIANKNRVDHDKKQ